MEKTFTVSEITSLIKRSLEENFSEVSLIGEISNFKAHVSGHWYFTLKDSNAQISCTMWKGINSYVFFTPQDGMKIVVSGRVTVYPPRGSYQIEVRSMKPAGVGELQAAFEKLKSKLAEEGLFDESLKKPIPSFPKKIGIVTAIGGAALKDMLNIAKRRYPLVEIVVAPSKVQGERAAEEIADSINLLNKESDVDVIIVGRGGGSIEDLWAFNEEILARAIFNSKIPVISGVGHEIDFTIADYVSDLRAPTPSSAMELATPDKDDIFAFIDDFSYNSSTNILKIINSFRSRVLQIVKSYGFKLPQDLIKNKTQYLDNLVYRMQNNIVKKISFTKNKLSYFVKFLETQNVEHLLKKGFAIIKQNDQIIQRAKKFNKAHTFNIQFYDGEVKVK